MEPIYTSNRIGFVAEHLVKPDKDSVSSQTENRLPNFPQQAYFSKVTLFEALFLF